MYDHTTARQQIIKSARHHIFTQVFHYSTIPVYMQWNSALSFYLVMAVIIHVFKSFVTQFSGK